MYREKERDISSEMLNLIYKEMQRISKEFLEKYTELKPAIEFLRDKLSSQRGMLEKISDYFNSYNDVITSYAIDTSFLASSLTLVYGDLVIYTAGYIRFPRYKTKNSEINRLLWLKSRLETKRMITSFILSVESHILERKLALELLKKRRDGEEGFDFDAIYIDGPILPLPLPPPRRDYVKELELVTDRMIREAKMQKVSVIGVVKRVRSKILARIFLSDYPKYEELKDIANDKAITTLMLNRGETIKLGTLKNKAVLEGIAGDKMDVERILSYIAEYEWLGNEYIAFLKPKNAEQSVTVEILDFGNLGVDRILSWTNEHSSQSGCPHFLDAVDAFVKIEPNVVEIARRVLIKHAISKAPEAAIIRLLEHADLQKKFAPRMG